MACGARGPADADPPPESADDARMTWVMWWWLIAFLGAVVFGVITYLLGWVFQRGLRQ